MQAPSISATAAILSLLNKLCKESAFNTHRTSKDGIFFSPGAISFFLFAQCHTMATRTPRSPATGAFDAKKKASQVGSGFVGTPTPITARQHIEIQTS